MTPDADSVLAGFRPATSVFYLDISENVLVPKLIKYIQVNGSVRIIELENVGLILCLRSNAHPSWTRM